MEKQEKNCCVIVPVYKKDLQGFEKKSLLRTSQILRNFDLTIVCPETLDVKDICEMLLPQKVTIVRFENSYFNNIEGYNKLMLSDSFYSKFEKYKYVLIAQLDVYIFKDDLQIWIDKNYDYIGAPWIDSENTFIRNLSRFITKYSKIITNKKTKDYNHINKVGNGGFSLRKTEMFSSLSKKHKKEISANLSQKRDDNYHIEDVFWSIQIPTLEANFKIPNYLEALHFCIDRKPKIAMKLINNKLPFACHGFNKPKVKKFWSKYLTVSQ